MDILTRQELRSLMEVRGGNHVSILMPTHRTGPETRQHRLRFKNLLSLASQRLDAAGLRQPETTALLEPAQRLVHDSLFWSHQGDGLAVFLAEGIAEVLRLPLEVPELVVVSDRFHIKPLLPLISGDGRFYLLAISRKRIRLFQASRYSLIDVQLSGAQGSLDEALRGLDPQRQLQFHTGTQAPGGTGRRSAIFHGHGAGSGGTKAGILHYFHQVDESVKGALSGEQSPLVLAAVSDLLPIYREANSYPFLVGSVAGSPERQSRAMLHRGGWDSVAPLFSEGRRNAVDRYNQFATTGLTTNTLEGILPASVGGGVEVLFVAVGVQQWGRFDPSTGEVCLHAEEEPGDEDLLDLAAAQTFLNGGTVYAVAPDEVPGGGPLGALLRWELPAEG